MIGLDGKLHERTETLYVCDEYKIFFLTGQANGTGRRAYIAAKAFHTLDEDTIANMRTKAKSWTEAESSVQIAASQGVLAFRDTLTGTVSNIPWGELDDDVQRRLRGVGSDAFAKYAGPARTTSKDIIVGKPLALKKSINL